MNRPEFVTDEDLARWNRCMDNDTNLPSFIRTIPIMQEVCYAGLWFAESLSDLNVSDERITALQFTAGRYAFGRDPWAAHQDLLEKYKAGEIKFAEDLEDPVTENA